MLAICLAMLETKQDQRLFRFARGKNIYRI